MAEEQQAEQDVATQAPDTPQPEAVENEAEPEPEPDWKAQAETTAATLAQLQQELKTEQGRSRKRDDQDSAIAGIGDRIIAMEQSNAALIKALAAGDTQNLPNQLNQIQAQSQNTQRSRAYQTQYDVLTQQLRQATLDSDGNTILDLYNAPELEEVRAKWVDANKKHSLAGLYSTLVQAHEVTRQAERTQAKQTNDTVRDEERKMANQRLEEAGIYDLDTGPARGGGAAQDGWTWFTQTYRNMANPTSEDHKRARRINNAR